MRVINHPPPLQHVIIWTYDHMIIWHTLIWQRNIDHYGPFAILAQAFTCTLFRASLLSFPLPEWSTGPLFSALWKGSNFKHFMLKLTSIVYFSRYDLKGYLELVHGSSHAPRIPWKHSMEFLSKGNNSLWILTNNPNGIIPCGFPGSLDPGEMTKQLCHKMQNVLNLLSGVCIAFA